MKGVCQPTTKPTAGHTLQASWVDLGEALHGTEQIRLKLLSKQSVVSLRLGLLLEENEIVFSIVGCKWDIQQLGIKKLQ